MKLKNIYSSFEFVEYTNTSGNECMFCVVDDYELSNISNCYRKHNIIFKVIELTKDVLFDNSFKINYKNQYGFNIKDRVVELISNFKYQNTTPDIVLDKIIEKGIESLTDFDHSILEKV